MMEKNKKQTTGTLRCHFSNRLRPDLHGRITAEYFHHLPWIGNVLLRDKRELFFQDRLLVTREPWYLLDFRFWASVWASFGWIVAMVTCLSGRSQPSSVITSSQLRRHGGVWMSGSVQSTGQTQCKVYHSMLVLSMDVKVSRALIIIISILLSIAGDKCTNCVEDVCSTVSL